MSSTILDLTLTDSSDYSTEVQKTAGGTSSSKRRLNPFRGAYNASGNTYPAAGSGSGVGGQILAGDKWYMSVIDTGGLPGGPWVLNTFLEALIDTPGQTNSNWRIY